MSALPNPETPPPAPEVHAPNPRVSPVRTPRREHTDPPVSATVRLCLVDPAADADEIVTAAVSMITTTYTAPGDRIMLASPETPATGSSRTRRDRLVETVLRLGRGATTGPHSWRPGDHESPATSSGLHAAPRSEAGLRPRGAATTKPVANPTGQQPLDEPSGPSSDGFALIITGWSDHPADRFAMTDWGPVLAPNGSLAVLTHSSDNCRVRADRSARFSPAATRAGLILIDRLLLAHQPPARARPMTRRNHRAIAPDSHCLSHPIANVFRRSTPSPEVRHA